MSSASPALDPSDSQLARQSQAGDRDALEELLRRHRPRLVLWMGTLIWDQDEAESLAQEALTRAMTGLGRFDASQPFAAWLHGIGLNLCRNHLRSLSRHAVTTGDAALQQVAAKSGRRLGVLSGILRGELEQQTLAAIQALPLALREAFVLHELEDFDYDEMGRMCGVSAATLRVRVHRAKALLRDRLGSLVDTWLRGAK